MATELHPLSLPGCALSKPGVECGRIVEIDIIRGGALLGVLLTNLQSLTYPGGYLPPLSFPSHSALDRGIEALIHIFIEGSFYPLFATLFGLGFALQMQRPKFMPAHFRRRLLLLLGFGVLHAVLVWDGDILVSYALLGFALLPLHRIRSRTLVVLISCCLLYSLIIFTAAFQLGNTKPRRTDTIAEIYAQGSYLEVTRVRLVDLSAVGVEAVLYFPHLLSCFLVGLLIGRRGVRETLHDRTLLRHVLALSGGIALPIVTVYGATLLQTPRVPAWLSGLDGALGSASLGFAYTGALALSLQSPTWQRRLRPLAAVGRMSLTNYLMQSLIFTLLFYGYGGGLYARVPLSVSVLLALALYAIQMYLSRRWLARYPQGPVEALWRNVANSGSSEESTPTLVR